SGRQAHCPQCQGMVAVPESRVDCGATLGGFRLDRRLGKGGMGEVFLATQLSVDRQVAVKVLPPSFAADHEAVERFLHEGRLAARLDHANIVTVYEAGEDGGNYYLAMACVEGESLDRRLKRDGALPEREALTIVRTIAEALCYAWDEFQLLHRDLKPANIMLDRRGRVFLMDLGLAKSLGEETGMTLSGAILGTPHYMSPEQAMGSSQLSVQTDIYALGAPLTYLSLAKVPVADLSPLAGAPLVGLNLGWAAGVPSEVKDIRVLRGMPLRYLNLGACTALTDLSPILSCPDLEALWTPSHLPMPEAEIRAALRHLVHLNVEPAQYQPSIAEFYRCRLAWERSLEDAAEPARAGTGAAFAGLAKAVLAGRVDEALRRWRDGGENLGKGLTDDERQAVAAQLEALAGMDARLLASFKADAGKTIEVALARETIRGEVREAAADGIRFNQIVQHGQSTGRLGRVIRLNDLAIAERLRRLGAGDTPELNLQRGLLALEAAKPEVAGRLFDKAGGPLGEAMAAALAVRQTEAREAAAEQAAADLLRQITTSPRHADGAAAAASVRKRIGNDLKRLQAARKALAEFEKEWGSTAAGREWVPMARRALMIPIAGDGPLQVPDLGMELVPLAAGEFLMGLAKGGWSGEEAIHTVRLSRPFWMGRFEVTQDEYAAVMNQRPGSMAGPRRPVEMVSWFDATLFASRLTAREQAAGRLPDGYVFRLPTEAEWEYACRAGTTGDYPADLDAIAWYDKNSGGKTHDVGQKKPNAWGLYDLCGNVFEWCQDWYSKTWYARSPAVDPVCLRQENPMRISRGGSWAEDSNRCRSGFRYPAWGPDAKLDRLGFRVVLAPPLPSSPPP
ncbi:MAG: SUMF1/EgtB/PvdO family nonheme iron enzyme, partial [Lentisphaerae bacterium]|nr:SUMF1/EgtB/PvdO family nonheme iron enzyme [Lentisphaerota bacterium]